MSHESTFMARVAQAVVARMPATTSLDDLAPLFPEADRTGLKNALERARDRGLVRMARRGHGGRNGYPARWAAPLPPEAPAQRAASVWDFAAQFARRDER